MMSLISFSFRFFLCLFLIFSPLLLPYARSGDPCDPVPVGCVYKVSSYLAGDDAMMMMMNLNDIWKKTSLEKIDRPPLSPPFCRSVMYDKPYLAVSQ